MATGDSARYRRPWPGSTHRNSKSRSFSRERTCSFHEYQFTARDADSIPRDGLHHRWSAVKRKVSRYSRQMEPGVWPGTGMTRRSSARTTGSSPTR
jgi:hypothetical protein